MLAWLLDLGFAARRFGTPPPPIVSHEIAAGARRRRVLYLINVDGQRFECGSLAQALKLLAQAKVLARQRAQEHTRVALRQRKAVPKLALPKITASKELRLAVTETKREIRDIYDSAAIDTEIAWLMELNQRRDDENDILMLLM